MVRVMTSPPEHRAAAPDDVWLTLDEAAARLKVSPRQIDRYVELGRLPEHRLGDTPKAPKRYRPAELDALVIPRPVTGRTEHED